MTAGCGGSSQELGCWIAGPGRAAIGAFVVVFLLAFQEFEIASLMGVTAGDAHSPVSWTVWLFDAHAGGVPLAESLRVRGGSARLRVVVVLPAAVVLPAWMTPGLPTPTRRLPGGKGESFPAEWSCCHWRPCFWPAAVDRRCARGDARDRKLVDHAAGTSRNRDRRGNRRRGGRSRVGHRRGGCSGKLRGERGRAFVDRGMLSLPGLLGSLVFSLLILGLFQLPGLSSPVAVAGPADPGAGAVCLPRAVVVFAVTGVARRTPSGALRLDAGSVAGGRPAGGPPRG